MPSEMTNRGGAEELPEGLARCRSDFESPIEFRMRCIRFNQNASRNSLSFVSSAEALHGS